MSFLRRWRDGSRPPAEPDARARAAAPPDEPEPADATDEASRERELRREEARRLDDELLQRQLRWADRSWVPPRQGSDRRAEDGAGSAGEQ